MLRDHFFFLWSRCSNAWNDEKLAKHKHAYLSCSLNRFLSKSGKKTSQSNSSMTSVRYTRSHHGCSNATWMQMMCERHPDQTDNTSEMQKKLLLYCLFGSKHMESYSAAMRTRSRCYEITECWFIIIIFVCGCIHALQSAQLNTTRRQPSRAQRSLLPLLPCRLAPHLQSIWSQSGQREATLIPDWLQRPNLCIQSGRDLARSWKRIKVDRGCVYNWNKIKLPDLNAEVCHFKSAHWPEWIE